MIVFDLDDFKAINDRIGHLAGDGVLAEAAERLLTAVRTADIACRVGGDEFAVILPEGGVEDGEELAGRIAQAIAARPIGNAGVLQLSAGVAELRASDQPDDLFKRADDALYRAKELGKARTSQSTARRRAWLSAEAEVRQPVGQVDGRRLRRLVVLAGEARQRLVLAAAQPHRERRVLLLRDEPGAYGGRSLGERERAERRHLARDGHLDAVDDCAPAGREAEQAPGCLPADRDPGARIPEPALRRRTRARAAP